jgi:P27 family predicted phage terminase small subunit
MTAGRPPKPNELKRKLGNPGQRKLPDKNNVVVLAPIAKDVPDHLGEAGIQYWNQLKKTAPWIAESDRSALLLLCEKMDRRAEYIARLGDNYVLYTDKAYAYANPLVGMLTSIEADIGKSLSVLGLTPADRTRIGLGEVKAQSKLAELRAKKQNG